MRRDGADGAVPTLGRRDLLGAGAGAAGAAGLLGIGSLVLPGASAAASEVAVALSTCEVTAATARTRVGTVRYDAVTASTAFEVLDEPGPEPEPAPEPEPVSAAGPDGDGGVGPAATDEDARPTVVPTGAGSLGAPVRLWIGSVVVLAALLAGAGAGIRRPGRLHPVRTG